MPTYRKEGEIRYLQIRRIEGRPAAVLPRPFSRLAIARKRANRGTGNFELISPCIYTRHQYLSKYLSTCLSKSVKCGMQNLNSIKTVPSFLPERLSEMGAVRITQNQEAGIEQQGGSGPINLRRQWLYKIY